MLIYYGTAQNAFSPEGGAIMNDAHDQQDPSQEEEAPEEIDWDRRVLCSDENCIGVVGPDGRCKECGKPYEGELPAGFFDNQTEPRPETPPKAEPTPAPQGEHTAEDASAADPSLAPEPDSDSDPDWENRILCSDGNCIGVVGPDGRCKECGKPYDPESAD
jgi:hypothetical protein